MLLRTTRTSVIATMLVMSSPVLAIAQTNGAGTAGAPSAGTTATMDGTAATTPAVTAGVGMTSAGVNGGYSGGGWWGLIGLFGLFGLAGMRSRRSRPPM